MEKVRFGVIGTNWITEAFIQAAKETPDFELTAVYSRTTERAREFADKHGAAGAYDDIGAMAAGGEIDAVYIASPNFLHAEHAIACMRHGVHVLCEKPLASNAAEARAMIEASERHGVVLMEAIKPVFLPNFAVIRDSLGKIGNVRRYFASFCQYSSRYDAFRAGTVLNAFNPALSNGALMDLGIYCLYPAIALFGRPLEAKANGVMLSSGVDGEGSMLLRYPDMEGVIQYSKISSSSLPSEIQGEDGTIVIDQISQPSRVEIRYRDGRILDASVPQSASTMTYEARAFIEAVKAGERRSAFYSPSDSLAVMETMDEARRQMGLVYPADAKS